MLRRRFFTCGLPCFFTCGLPFNKHADDPAILLAAGWPASSQTGGTTHDRLP